MKIIKYGIILFVFCVTGFVVVNTVSKKKAQQANFIHANLRDIEKTITISGVILPEREIEIKSTISGILETLSVRVGDDVQAGQAIASIKYVKDPMSYKQLLRDLEITRVRLDNASANFQSTENLYRKKLIAYLDYEKEKHELAILRSEYESVKSELNMLRGIYEGKEISNIITATGNGTILELPIKEGGSVMARGTLSEGTTIARLADMKSLVFKGDVLESDLMKLRIGMPVSFALASDNSVMLGGKIEMISPKGFIRDGVARFQITANMDIPTAYRKYVKAGCTANATAVIEKKTKVLALEEKYFQFSYDSVYVEVQKTDGEYERRYLKTGISDGTYTEIVSGLSRKDKIKNNEKYIK